MWFGVVSWRFGWFDGDLGWLGGIVAQEAR